MSLKRKISKGYIVNEDTNDVLLFQYNPEEFYTSHGANYEEIEAAGSKYRKFSYAGRSSEEFNLNLEFYGVRNVSKGKSSSDIEKYLERLTLPKRRQKGFIKGSNHFISPPTCTIVIGKLVQEGVVESVKIERKMFNSKLDTMRLGTQIKFKILKR